MNTPSRLGSSVIISAAAAKRKSDHYAEVCNKRMKAENFVTGNRNFIDYCKFQSQLFNIEMAIRQNETKKMELKESVLRDRIELEKAKTAILEYDFTKEHRPIEYSLNRQTLNATNAQNKLIVTKITKKEEERNKDLVRMEHNANHLFLRKALIEKHSTMCLNRIEVGELNNAIDNYAKNC